MPAPGNLAPPSRPASATDEPQADAVGVSCAGSDRGPSWGALQRREPAADTDRRRAARQGPVVASTRLPAAGGNGVQGEHLAPAGSCVEDPAVGLIWTLS